MAALIDDYRAPRGPRQMRFRRPVQEAVPIARPHTTDRRSVYTATSPRVPYPANLAPLLRRDDRERHWAAVLSEIFGGVRAVLVQDLPPAAGALRELLDMRVCHPLAYRLVLDLVPTVDCPRCGWPTLAENARRAYCCDRCRREAARVRTGAGRAALSACRRCGGALAFGRRVYCGDACARLAKLAGERERQRRLRGHGPAPMRAATIPTHKAAILAARARGETYRTISERLGCSVSAIQRWVVRWEGEGHAI